MNSFYIYPTQDLRQQKSFLKNKKKSTRRFFTSTDAGLFSKLFLKDIPKLIYDCQKLNFLFNKPFTYQKKKMSVLIVLIAELNLVRKTNLTWGNLTNKKPPPTG